MTFGKVSRLHLSMRYRETKSAKKKKKDQVVKGSIRYRLQLKRFPSSSKAAGFLAAAASKLRTNITDARTLVN